MGDEKEAVILKLAYNISDQLLAMQDALSKTLNRGEDKAEESRNPGAVGRTTLPSVVDEITTTLEWNNKHLDELRTILQTRILNRLG